MKARIVFIMLTWWMVIGCASNHKLAQVPVMQTITYEPQLIPIHAPADSALLRMLLECDSAGNVVLKELEELKGKGVATRLSVEGGMIAYKANFKGKDSTAIVHHITATKEVPVEVPVPYEVNVLTWYQRILMALGVLLIIVILVKIIINALRNI